MTAILRTIAVAFVLLGNLGVRADQPLLPEAGTWIGTLGTQEVMACFRHDKSGTGALQTWAAYFYQKHGTLIQLIQLEEKAGHWMEQGKQGPTGSWTFSIEPNGFLVGHWSDPKGQNTAPLRLRRFKTLASPESYDSCGSESDGGFSADVTRRWRTERTTRTVETTANGKQYQVVSILGAVSTIKLNGRGEGLLRLNDRLSNEMRVGIGGYLSCPTRGSKEQQKLSQKEKPDYNFRVDPLFWNDRWISLAKNVSGDCGGAHPFSDVARSNWDLSTGNPINLWAWFRASKRPDASRKHGQNDSSDEALEELYQLIADRAVKSRLDFNPKEAEQDQNCLDTLQTSREYQVTFGTKGLVFSHNFPHASQACNDDIEIPYRRLLPFLTSEGKGHITRLMRTIPP